MTATTDTPNDDRGPAAPAGGRFDAFVSYSREDAPLAAAVQGGLERLGKRWRSRRALRVFRDVANLGATPELWPSVRAALDESRFLVLVASPAAARSEWVTREVEHFVGMRGADRILLAIADGTCAWDATEGRFDSSTDCLPPPLLGAFAEEPAYVDLTWAQTGQQADLENHRFRAAIADLAAPVHGVERDELEALDLREFRRGRRFRRGAAVMVIALALATTVAAMLATRSAIESRRQRDLAEANLQVSEARRLAALSESTAGSRTDLAALLALESLRRSETSEGRLALGRSVMQPAAALGPMVTHDDPVRAVAIDPTGTMAASAGDGVPPVVIVTNVVTGEELLRLRGHDRWVGGLAFSADGGLLASAGADGIRLWSMPTGQAMGELVDESEGVSAVAFTPAGRLVSGGIDSTVHVWDVLSLRELDVWNGHEDAVESLAVTPDGRFVLSGSNDGTVVVWNLSGAVVRRLRISDAAVHLTVDDAGRYLATYTGEGEVTLWGTDDWSEISRTRLDGPAGAGAFRTRGELLAVGDERGHVHLLDVPSLIEQDDRLIADEQSVEDLAVSPDGSWLVVAGFDNDVERWNLDVRDPVGSIEGQSDGARSMVLEAGLAVTADHGLRWWDPVTGSVLATANYDLAALTALEGSPAITIAGDHLGHLATWDPTSGDRVAGPVRAHDGSVNDLVLSPNGDQLVSAGADGALRVWDPRTLAPLGPPVQAEPDKLEISSDRTYLNPVNGMAMSAGGTIFTAVTERVRAWKVDGGRLVEGAPSFAEVPDTHITALAVTKDGSRVALARTRAGDEGNPTVEVWEPGGDRGRTLGSFDLRALRFSPDGSVLAVAGPDGITMVDVVTGRAIGRIRSGPTTDAWFTPDGRAIVAGQGTIWRGPAAWATFGCAIAGGPLSDERWRELIDPNPTRERACR